MAWLIVVTRSAAKAAPPTTSGPNTSEVQSQVTCSCHHFAVEGSS